MNIKISKVEIKNAGPINSFNEEFKPLTLIYGKNESGKTTIVENILAALFKRGKKNRLVEYLPSLRDADFLGGAKVEVSGLDKNIVSFNGKKSLDEYLDNDNENLPLSLLNLLFIKEGDAKLINQKGGLTKDILKQMIAGNNSLKKISDNLSKAIQDVVIEDGKFSNFKRNTKESKSYLTASSNLENLQRLENSYWQDAAELKRIELETNLTNQKEILVEMEQARKHSAFKIATNLELLRGQSIGFNEKDLSELAKNSNELDRAIEQKNSIREQLSEFSLDKDHLYWLEASKDSYNKLNVRTTNQHSTVFVVISAILLLMTIGVSFIQPRFVPFMGGLAFLFIVINYLVNKKASTKLSVGENDIRIDKLKVNFFQRFGKQLRSSEDISVELRILTERKGSFNALTTQKNKLEQTILNLEARIKQLQIKTGGSSRTLNILEHVSKKQKELRKNENRIIILSEKLTSLGVDVSDYLEVDPGMVYSMASMSSLQKKINLLKDEISELVKNNQSKRQELAVAIGLTTNIIPSEVSDKISEKIAELQFTKEQNLAKIIGDYYLNEVLEEMKETEDERLKEFINCPQVVTRIKEVTNNYERIDFAGEDLLIENGIDSFLLKNLSTGTNEQVLLSLRMGISEKLSHSSSMFMIFDDAFQSSDWDRRDKLISSVIAMVKSGWQIIYFTMDDDIRDRFKKAAKSLDGVDFKLKELN